MDGRERAAAAHATGGAVARVTRAVAGTHEALTDTVRAGLAPLGPVGRLPFEASALMARFNFAAVETVARGVGAVAAPVLEATAAPDARPASEHLPAVGWLAALGGAFGDRLVADQRVRALAVPMSVRDRGPLVEIDPDPATDGPALDRCPTVVVFVHGLGNHESMWGQSYLDVVRAHGATPMTVRYTTGQAIADSGAELADLLDRLVAAWPVAVDRIVLVGHSMGGWSSVRPSPPAGPGARGSRTSSPSGRHTRERRWSGPLSVGWRWPRRCRSWLLGQPLAMSAARGSRTSGSLTSHTPLPVPTGIWSQPHCARTTPAASWVALDRACSGRWVTAW